MAKWQVKWLAITSIMIHILFLSGCTDSRSPERMAYAHGLVVDYQDGKYIIYLQLLNLGLLAKSESGGGLEEQAEIGRSTGKNIGDAIFKLYRTTQEEVYWGNLSYIITSERLLKEKGIKPLLDLWDRYPEARYQIFFYSAKDDLEKALLVKPVLDVAKVLNKIADPKNSFAQSSLVPYVTLRELLIQLNEPNHIGMIPSIFVPENTWKTPNGPEQLIGINGLTLYDQKKHLLGTLVDKDIEGYRWVSKKYNRSNIVLQKKGNPIAELIVNKRKVTIKPLFEKGQLRFHLKIKIKGAVSELDNSPSLKELEQIATETVKKQVLFTYQNALALDADIYRLSEILYRKNLKAWKQRETNGKIPLEADSLKVDVKILITNGQRMHLRQNVD